MTDYKERKEGLGMGLNRGWKEIGKRWGLKGVNFQTVRRLARALNMPIIYIENRPTIEDQSFDIWWAKTLQKALKHHKFSKYFKSDTF